MYIYTYVCKKQLPDMSYYLHIIYNKEPILNKRVSNSCMGYQKLAH